MAEKMYRFSGTKHAHDIEFRRNRVYIERHDMEMGDTPWNDATYDKMTELYDQLTELMLYMHEGVCMIPGRLYGLASETVAWAGMKRGRVAR